jgi:hypothetical protein
MSLVEDLQDEIRTMMAYRSAGRRVQIETAAFEASPEPRDMVAVDGSYTFLWNVSSMWLAVVRVGYLRYRLRDGVFRKVGFERIDRSIMVSTREEVVQKQDELHQMLFEATRHSSKQHADMVNEYRRHLEGEIARIAAEENEGAVLALDGSLASFPKELDNLGEVVDACAKNDVVLVGVSKDSTTHAFGSPLTDEEVLEADGTAYARVPREFEKSQRGLLHGDVYFAKLHRSAPKWFRVDVGTYRDDPDHVFSQLAPYSMSALSLGYPYPLMEAHRFAVTVRQFKSMYEGEVIRQAVRLGADVREIVAGLTQIEGRRKSAFHEYLDKVAREVR